MKYFRNKITTIISGYSDEHSLRLFERPDDWEEIVVTAKTPSPEFVWYHNVYPSGSICRYRTRKDADSHAAADRVSCQRVVFTEGVFDD